MQDCKTDGCGSVGFTLVLDLHKASCCFLGVSEPTDIEGIGGVGIRTGSRENSPHRYKECG